MYYALMDFIFFLIVMGLIIYSLVNNARRSNVIDVRSPLDQIQTSLRKITAPIILGIFVIVVLFSSVIVIPPGQTGVFELFGKVSDNELHSGIHLINPLGKVTKMSVRTEEYTMSIASAEGQIKGDDSITALTNEGLEIKLDITVLYRLDESAASDVYRTLGLDYVAKVIRPSIRSIIREEAAKFSSKEIYASKREELSASITEQLSMDLLERGLILEDVLLRNVLLPNSIAQSIEQKLTAEQDAQRYDFILEQEKKEAERKRIEAEGQRDSQEIINQSLSDQYLNYLYITSLKDRQGTIYVPTNPENGLPLFRNTP